MATQNHFVPTDRQTDRRISSRKTVKLEAEIELNLWEIEPVKSLPSVEQGAQFPSLEIAE